MIQPLLIWYRKSDSWKLMAWYLTVLIVVGLYEFGIIDGVIRFALVMAVGALDFFLHRLHTKDYNKWPLSGVITARIVWLVYPFDVPLWLLATTILVALSAKHLIRWGSRHIFNPAAFGLTVMGLATGTTFGWWGDTIPWLAILLVLPIIWKVKKQVQIISFLITHAILFLLTQFSSVTSGGVDAGSFLLLGLSWFFVLVMVPEPMTTPATRRDQISFGILVAALSLALSYVSPVANVALPLSLLVGNLVAAYLRTRPIIVPAPTAARTS